MKDCIQSQIVADINNQISDPYYGISVGEVDCSNLEQLWYCTAICKRFSRS